MIQRRFSTDTINKVNTTLATLMGRNIPREPPKTLKGKVITRTLSQVVQLENERASIYQMQKNGRKQAVVQAASQTPVHNKYHSEFKGFPTSLKAQHSHSRNNITETPTSEPSPLRQSHRLRRPTKRALELRPSTPEPEPSTLASNSVPLLPAEGRTARTAAKRAASAILEMALIMPIPPKRRRK